MVARRVSILLRRCALAVVLALVLLPQAAFANSSVYARRQGGNVYPVQSTAVRMEAETVQAIVYGPYAEYRVTFRFRNEGKAQNVTLGFPFGYEADPEWGHGAEPVAAFTTTVNGKRSAVRIGRGEKTEYGTDLVYLWDARLGTGVSTVTVAYVCGPSLERPQWFEYWLHTGRWWKGTIGKSVVRFTLSDRVLAAGASVHTTDPSAWNPYLRPPGSSSPTRGVTQWVFEDYEPEMPGQSATGGPVATHDIVFPLDYPDGWAAFALVDNNREGYSPDPACDGSALTSWIASGTTPSRTVAVPPSVRHIGEVRLLPGNCLTLDSFEQWGRPARVRLRFSDGSAQIVSLPDEPGLTRLRVDAPAGTMTVEVLDAYPGTQHEEVAIAEIDVDANPSPEFLAFDELIAATAGDAQQPPRSPAAPATGYPSARRPTTITTALIAVAALAILAALVVLARWRRKRST